MGCRGRGDAQLEEVRVPLEVLGGVQEWGGCTTGGGWGSLWKFWLGCRGEGCTAERNGGVPMEVLGGCRGSQRGCIAGGNGWSLWRCNARSRREPP